MSNYLAIAQVTSTLRYLVTNSLPPDLSGAVVTTQRPDGQLGMDNAAGVNVFLYRVAPNASYRNADLPGRDNGGGLLARPTIALDLDYLFTFYGNDGDLEPQRLLGSVATTLHTIPVLSSDEIAKALLSMQPFRSSPFGAAPFTAPPYQPDLGQAVDRVRLRMLPLSLDELSKLWSVFYQIPYALTVAYQASVVLMQREDAIPQTAPPVQTRVVSAQPWHPPVIASIASQAGLQAPIVQGSTLVVSGSSLSVAGQTISLSNYATPLIPLSASDQQLIVALPADVPAGSRVLQLNRSYPLGSPAVPHPVGSPASAAFVLRPTLAAAPTFATGALTLAVKPDVRAGQTVTVLLNEATSPAPAQPLAYTFPVAALAADAGTLKVPVPGLAPAKTYFVRVQVDGAESGLDFNPASATFGPTVTLP